MATNRNKRRSRKYGKFIRTKKGSKRRCKKSKRERKRKRKTKRKTKRKSFKMLASSNACENYKLKRECEADGMECVWLGTKDRRMERLGGRPGIGCVSLDRASDLLDDYAGIISSRSRIMIGQNRRADTIRESNNYQDNLLKNTVKRRLAEMGITEDMADYKEIFRDTLYQLSQRVESATVSREAQLRERDRRRQQRDSQIRERDRQRQIQSERRAQLRLQREQRRQRERERQRRQLEESQAYILRRNEERVSELETQFSNEEGDECPICMSVLPISFGNLLEQLKLTKYKREMNLLGYNNMKDVINKYNENKHEFIGQCLELGMTNAALRKLTKAIDDLSVYQRTLPCGHEFHKACVNKLTRKKCPMCRAAFKFRFI